MKRECLLSRAYTGPPMTFQGVELVYSSLVHELMRDSANSFFAGGKSTTEHLGLVEGVFVMWCLARGDKEALRQHLDKTTAERASAMVRFNLEHEEEIEKVKPIIVKRAEAVMAAMVESEGPGKPLSPVPDSSP